MPTHWINEFIRSASTRGNVDQIVYPFQTPVIFIHLRIVRWKLELPLRAIRDFVPQKSAKSYRDFYCRKMVFFAPRVETDCEREKFESDKSN